MNLERVQSKFASTELLAWSPSLSAWRPTGVFGSLQVFDRFITERTFGQKKRILTVPERYRMDPAITTVKVRGSDSVFLVEKFNDDVRFNSSYAITYLLHEAQYEADLCKASTTTNAAGVKVISGETVLAHLWADIERFTASASKAFDESEYTIVSVTLPRGAPVDTDCYLKLASGIRYNIDEVFLSLDLVAAKGKRVGVRP